MCADCRSQSPKPWLANWGIRYKGTRPINLDKLPKIYLISLITSALVSGSIALGCSYGEIERTTIPPSTLNPAHTPVSNQVSSPVASDQRVDQVSTEEANVTVEAIPTAGSITPEIHETSAVPIVPPSTLAVGINATATIDPIRTPTTVTPNSNQTSPTPLEPTATPTDETDGFQSPDLVTRVVEVTEALIGGRRFQLEIADTPAQRVRGLMERSSLPEDAAMLFVFEGERRRTFWMKNTLIPLDILFLDPLGMVVDIQTMHTQIGVPNSQLIKYTSTQPARYAIEMNAGLSEELEIMVGSQIRFR